MLLNKRVSVLYFVNHIKWQITGVIVFAFVVSYLDVYPIFKAIKLPVNIPALVGTALSLLLAFRTSQSYGRWSEARAIWGAIVNDSRSVVRLALQFMDKQDGVDFANRQILWVNVLTFSLRKLPFPNEIKQYLDSHSLKGTNIANVILDEHSKQVKALVFSGKLSELQQLQLNGLISNLCDSMGKCERIKNTVFPRFYSALIHFLIYFFMILLPFGLEDSPIAAEIGITIVVPLIFIIMDKTAILLQDPFENRPVDIPMSTLSRTIETNIKQMIGEELATIVEDNNLYYQM